MLLRYKFKEHKPEQFARCRLPMRQVPVRFRDKLVSVCEIPESGEVMLDLPDEAVELIMSDKAIISPYGQKDQHGREQLLNIQVEETD